MSVTKLLISGFLVAGGLILAAFTLHNQFAPRWEVQATGLRERESELPTAAKEREPSAAVGTAAVDWTPQLIRAQPEPDADAPKVRKHLEKKLAEKRPKKEKAKADEPKTVFPWLWNLLANNSK